MAELRWEIMFDTVADATSAANAAQEFRNETSRLLHIRRIRWAHRLHAADVDEAALTELSKAPVIQANTDESPFFSLPIDVGIGLAGATPADSNNTENGEALYGRGHLTLEPNESLFNNTAKSADGAFIARWVIGYEF